MLVIFATNLHHVMIEGMLGSYALISVGRFPDGDFAATYSDILSQAATVGLRLALPFVVFALIFQSGMGLLNRLSPQMNVFFVALPIQLLLGMGLMAITAPIIVRVQMEFLYESLIGLLLPQ